MGEPVAVAVVARDRWPALEQPWTRCDETFLYPRPLPVVLDLEGALAEGSPLVHGGQGHEQKCYTWGRSTRPRSAPAGTCAQAEKRGRGKRASSTRDYVQQRLIPASMEPRSVVVDPTGGELTVYSATQIPHIVRFLLAATTGTPGAQDPSGRTRCWWRLRRQAGCDAGGVDH